MSQKREELTNYEVSSRSINTIAAGYRIESISAAITINRKSLPKQLLEPDNSDNLKGHVAELEQLVSVAIGIDKSRGDTIKLLLVDFVSPDAETPKATSSLTAILASFAPTIVNGIFILVAIMAILFFAVRPLIGISERMLLQNENKDNQFISDKNQQFYERLSAPEAQNLNEDLSIHKSDATVEFATQQLKIAFENNPDRAINVMRKWISESRVA